MTPLVKRACALAIDVVCNWSDFKIQRTTPLDPAVMEQDDVKQLITQLQEEFPRVSPDDIAKCVRGALLNAQDTIKQERIAATTWDPYGGVTQLS